MGFRFFIKTITFSYGNDDENINGNGWCIIKSAQLIECFLQQRDNKSYVDLVINKEIVLNMENAILPKLKALNHNYAIYFDGMLDSTYRNRAALLIRNLN